MRLAALHRSGRIVIEVSDDGVGFDTGDEFPGHLGLRSMRERAQEQDGELWTLPRQPHGTRVLARLPATQPALIAEAG